MNEALTQAIKKQAALLGFEKVGVTRADALGNEGERYREWLARGYEATMKWMSGDPERRCDPGMVLPGAKSVVSVALNYYTSPEHSTDPAKGKVSRYAWGDDYHDIVRDKLEKLKQFIVKLSPETVCKVYCDTGPLLEKAIAARAGVGWVGKHTNLITQELGSWVFLGEVILSAELAYDEPATDHCGSCTLCIEACPTQAIVEPYVLDANRCISYLTIEHRGEIDAELGGHFEGWVYGCDICQDVCPWNEKFSASTGIPAFTARKETIAPELDGLISMTQEEFSRVFRKSPIKRTKLAGLRRNAEIVRSSVRDRSTAKEKQE